MAYNAGKNFQRFRKSKILTQTKFPVSVFVRLCVFDSFLDGSCVLVMKFLWPLPFGIGIFQFFFSRT